MHEQAIRIRGRRHSVRVARFGMPASQGRHPAAVGCQQDSPRSPHAISPIRRRGRGTGICRGLLAPGTAGGNESPCNTPLCMLPEHGHGSPSMDPEDDSRCCCRAPMMEAADRMPPPIGKSEARAMRSLSQTCPAYRNGTVRGLGVRAGTGTRMQAEVSPCAICPCKGPRYRADGTDGRTCP